MLVSKSSAVTAKSNLLLSTALGGSLFLALSLGMASSARADNECGVQNPGQTEVHCGPANNPYPNGITYIAPEDLTIVLKQGVIVDTSGGPDIGVLGITADPFASIALKAAGASITTDADGAFGVLLASTYGDVSITTGQVVTSGASAGGILGTTAYGKVTVDAGTVYTYGDNAAAIEGSVNGGNINVSAFTVYTNGAGSTGVYAHNTNYGNIVTDLGTVITKGDGADGVLARANYGDLKLSGDAILTYGDNAVGVDGSTFNGDVKADFFQVQTLGAGSDAIVVSTNNGSVHVNATAVSTDGDNARGIVATASDDATVVSQGFFVGTGGDNASAIVVRAGTGTASVNVGDAFTYGNNSLVIDAQSVSGPVKISAGGLTSRGDHSGAIAASGADLVDVSLLGSAHTYGDYSTAITATSTGGKVSVENAGAVHTEGTQSRGIYAHSDNRSVVISGTGSVTTGGDFSTGVYALGDTSLVQVTQGSVTTTGLASTGVNAIASSGPIAVDVTHVSTGGDFSTGVTGFSDGKVHVTVGTLSTVGDSSDGVDAISNLGLARIDATTVTTTGDGSAGLNAFGYAATINAHDIMTTGANSAGLVATSTGTGTEVSVTGTVSSARAVGAALYSAGAALITTSTGASISGDTDGILISSITGSQLNLAGSASSGSGFAVNAQGGAAQVNNDGEIDGRVSLTANADTVDNTGTFAAAGNSNFGGGVDMFRNTGIVTATGSVAFNNLEAFANAGGNVDLRNGHAGDTFTLPGTFTGGANSRLGLDVSLGGPSSLTDLLVVGGAATGNTRLDVVNTNPGAGQLNSGILVVDAGAGTDANAFTLNGGTIDSGLVNYRLVFNAASDNFLLVSAPNAGAAEMAFAAQANSNYWYKSADAWSAHMNELRDNAMQNSTANSSDMWAHPHLWAQYYGGREGRRAFQTDSFSGITQIFDTSYHQNNEGIEGGVDFLGNWMDGAMSAGVIGGYDNQRTQFTATGDGLRQEGYNIGAYASYFAGPLFVNALFKYDDFRLEPRNGGLAGIARFDGHSYGGLLEAGHRIDADSFFAEPFVSISYVTTDYDRAGTASGDFDYRNNDSVRGKFGTRIGSTIAMSEDWSVEPYAGIAAVRDFDGGGDADFTSGGFSVPIHSGMSPAWYGQGTFGLNVAGPGVVSGFAEGDMDFGRGINGTSGRVGVKIAL